MLTRVAIALYLLTVGCAGAPRPAVRLADGGFLLTCQGPLAKCLERADKLCHGQGGYWVSEASDRQELLGHEMGQSQVEIRRSEANVYCGKPRPAERPAIELRRSEPPAATPPERVEAPAHPPAKACVPGATQACTGKAGCTGGQACAPDGTRFESCDCGDVPPAATPTDEPAPARR